MCCGDEQGVEKAMGIGGKRCEMDGKCQWKWELEWALEWGNVGIGGVWTMQKESASVCGVGVERRQGMIGKGWWWGVVACGFCEGD